MGLPEAQLHNPLRELYARHNRPAPILTVVPADSLPQPQRRLLVHNRDMTPTLELHHQAKMRLRVLDRYLDADLLVRMVVLETVDPPHRPAEIGAIKIHLHQYADAIRRQILECRIPLGTLLANYNIAHTCRPAAYFQVAADEKMMQALDLQTACMLFGRFNSLYNHRRQRMAEVVEILPPTRSGDAAS